MMHLKDLLERGKNRKQAILKITAKINGIEIKKKNPANCNKKEPFFFKKMNKTNI